MLKQYVIMPQIFTFLKRLFLKAILGSQQIRREVVEISRIQPCLFKIYIVKDSHKNREMLQILNRNLVSSGINIYILRSVPVRDKT